MISSAPQPLAAQAGPENDQERETSQQVTISEKSLAPVAAPPSASPLAPASVPVPVAAPPSASPLAPTPVPVPVAAPPSASPLAPTPVPVPVPAPPSASPSAPSSSCPTAFLDAQAPASGYCCYLLLSWEGRSHRPRIYIGCTNNLTRRLRQHNGEIVGGARATKRWRPWEMFLVVTNFSSRSQALSFEWKWQRVPGRRRRISSLSAAVARGQQLIDQSAARWYYFPPAATLFLAPRSSDPIPGKK